MSGFVPNKLVQECIANNDIKGLKGAFAGIIFSDRSFSKGEFEETLNNIPKELKSKIIESFDNGELISKKIKSGNITEDDFGEAVYNLKVNFCRERIDDVKKLGQFLYGNKMKTQGTTSSNADGGNEEGKKPSGYQMNNANSKKESNKGLVVAGIVTAAALAVAIGFLIKSMK